MTRRLRVLELLVSTSPGGGPRHVYDLVRHLARDEFDVIIGAPRDGVFFERFCALGLPVVELSLGQLGIQSIFGTMRAMRRFDVQLVHTHGKGPGLYGRLAARRLRLPAIHTFHGIHYASYPAAGQALYLAMERGLSRWTHTVINVSASQEVEGLRLGLFRRGQSATIVNGVDFEELDRALLDAPLRRETLGLEPEDFVIGSVGRFDPIKRVEVLLDALRELKDRIPRAVLLLVGGGGEEDRIRRRAWAMGLHDRVIFTGFLGNPMRVYPMLDLYAAASLKEGLPLTVVEAMGAGLAVVATDISGHRDVVIPDQTGLLVSPGDSTAMARAVVCLWGDSERRAALGAAGRRRAREEFGIRTMVARTGEVYRRAVAAWPDGPRRAAKTRDDMAGR